MRSKSTWFTAVLLSCVIALPAVAQTVTEVSPSLLGQSLSRAVARVNISGSFGDNRQISDGLQITIADNVYGRGTRTYEFNTSGGLNNGSAIEFAPIDDTVPGVFQEFQDFINADATSPVTAQYYYFGAVGNGWFMLVWKYDNEWRDGANGPSVSEAADPGGDITVASNFATTNTDTAPVYIQLRGTDLDLLNSSSSVKLRHDVNTTDVYNGTIVVKYATNATAWFKLANGTGSPATTFPTLGEYDLEIDGSVVIDKAVTLVSNLLDDQTFRLHATGFELGLYWNLGPAELSPYWQRTEKYPNTDGIKKGLTNPQIAPRIYPFPTGPQSGNPPSGNFDNEYASIQWAADDGMHKIWQTVYVDFTQDTTLTLTGLWAGAGDQAPLTYGAQLRAGDENGTIIAETPPGQKVANAFNWTDFAVSGLFPNGTDEVTVVFYGEHPSDNPASLHVENVLLRVDNDHPTPPSITGMSTPGYVVTGDTDATVTLTGVNLASGQTSVSLRQPDINGRRMTWADQGMKVTVTGNILSNVDDASFATYVEGTADKMIITSGGPAAFPAGNVVPGEYTITQRDSDYTLTLADDINGGGGNVLNSSITGYIVNESIAATSVVANGATATATFDLTDVPVGYYNIVVEVGTHDPIVWREGLSIVNPGPNLANGSFELPAEDVEEDCLTNRDEEYVPATEWRGRYWDRYLNNSDPIFQYRDDTWGGTGFPTCPDASLGIHYHSALNYEDQGGAQFAQTVTSAPGTTYTLSGYFGHWAEGGGTNTVVLELLDGDSTGTPMPGASLEVLPSTEPQLDWTFAYVEGTASGELMTAAWEVTPVGNEAPQVVWTDALVLEECTQPVTLTSIDPPAVANDEVGPIVLTITGSGFSGGTPEVIFSTLGQTIFGTNVNVVNDTTLTCEVSDLPMPGAVLYDVIVRSNGCIDSLDDGFISAPTTIANPGFEEPLAPLFCGSEDPEDPRISNLEPVSYWNASDELIREGLVQFPIECPLLSCACPELLTGCDGGHYASMSTGEGEDEVAWQALKVDAGAGITFGGWFSWGGTGNVNIKLVDGYGPDGTQIASASVPTGNDWCYSTVQGFALSEVVTVVWELVDTANGSPAAVHADSMTFEASICNDPFADADADGDVDALDFALFQLCTSGSGNAYPTGVGFDYCECFDRDGPDGDVDQGDFAEFAGCYSGPDIPVDTACDD